MEKTWLPCLVVINWQAKEGCVEGLLKTSVFPTHWDSPSQIQQRSGMYNIFTNASKDAYAIVASGKYVFRPVDFKL